MERAFAPRRRAGWTIVTGRKDSKTLVARQYGSVDGNRMMVFVGMYAVLAALRADGVG